MTGHGEAQLTIPIMWLPASGDVHISGFTSQLYLTREPGVKG